MNTNPLQSYFRVPALVLELPSKGEWYPEGMLASDNGEVEVFPMTAKDDIILQTPDALLNGSATRKIIESCIPSIKDANWVPSIDLDSILIAIRIASYGETLTITSECPNEQCRNVDDYKIDLSSVLDRIQVPDLNVPAVYKDLKIFFKPQNFKTINSKNLEAYEQKRAIMVATNKDEDEENRLFILNDIVAKIADLTLNQITDSILYIEMPDGKKIDNVVHLNEFIDNCDRITYEAIKKKIFEMNAKNEKISDMHITCDKCGNEYITKLSLEFSDFFG